MTPEGKREPRLGYSMVESVPSGPTITICTLWEKDFHKGVGTLINSLVRVGFRGKVWVGYRGDLPSWSAGGVASGDRYTVSAGNCVEVIFVDLPTTIHFAQYKALWMMRVFTELDPEASGIYYFDPDIFVLGQWSFFEQWIEYGIAVCEDGSYPINSTHPLVRGWQAYAIKLGYSDWNFVGTQFNSGIVGIARAFQGFLPLWQVIMDSVRRDFKITESLKTSRRTDLFYATDQDALTLATCVSPYPVSWVGPDGMAFERGEWLTVHAYSPKPWRRRVLRDLLVDGHKPDSALRLYWDLAGKPLKVEPTARIKSHRWLIPLAALLSRFYRRSG